MAVMKQLTVEHLLHPNGDRCFIYYILWCLLLTFCCSVLDGSFLYVFLLLNWSGRASVHLFPWDRLGACFVVPLLITLQIAYTQVLFPECRNQHLSGLYAVAEVK